jgi:hypothetical protein
MRTTLTLDEDVAALLARVQRTRKASLKAIINEALRQGLAQMASPPRSHPRYETRSFDAGKCLVGSLDDVAEVLAVAEGEAFR